MDKKYGLTIDGNDHRDTYALRLVIAAVLLAIFIADLILMLNGMTEGIDESVGSALRSLRNDALNPIVIALTTMGTWKVIVAIGIVLFVLDMVKWRKLNVPLGIGACLIDLGLYLVLKPLIARERPDTALWLLIERGYSFPSGHTMNSCFCYGMMIYLLLRNSHSRPLTIVGTCLLSLLIAIIGLSRVFLGVHYITDVIAGASLGTSMLMVFTILIDEYLLRCKQKAGGR